MKLNPSNISWLSFSVIAVLVALLGLVGNQQIVRSLEAQFIAHSIGHAEEAANGLLPGLRAALRAGLPPEEAVIRFQTQDTKTSYLDGYSIALVDAKQGTILTALGAERQADGGHAIEYDSRFLSTIADPNARPWQVDADGQAVILTYFARVAQTAADPDWLLVLRTDIGKDIEAMHNLHYRISGLLLITVGLVAMAGFLVLRWLGRVYERHLEDTLRQRNGELQVVHAEMISKARLATLGQTASLLAHELRNPLASIKLGLSGLAKADKLGEREHRRINIALREVNRLEEMLSEALHFARPIRLASEPFALERLLDSVLRLLEPALLERKLQVNRIGCEDCSRIRLDPNQMKQVLLNLLKNAIEVSPPGGRIDVTVLPQGAWLQVDIGNEGTPIAPDELGRLFEPFYTTKPEGTGLGLVLVKRVVEEHGGEVYVTSSAQAGTHFSFRLPMHTAAIKAGRVSSGPSSTMDLTHR